MNKKQGHLEMIQGVVNRLSHNSFLLKGWTVVLISALLALGAKDKGPSFACLAYFPSIAFWYLDAYFLRQERLFRALYDRVRKSADKDIDYSMNVSSADISGINWVCVLLSKTLFIFHGAILGLITIIVYISM